MVRDHVPHEGCVASGVARIGYLDGLLGRQLARGLARGTWPYNRGLGVRIEGKQGHAQSKQHEGGDFHKGGERKATGSNVADLIGLRGFSFSRKAITRMLGIAAWGRHI